MPVKPSVDAHAQRVDVYVGRNHGRQAAVHCYVVARVVALKTGVAEPQCDIDAVGCREISHIESVDYVKPVDGYVGNRSCGLRIVIGTWRNDVVVGRDTVVDNGVKLHRLKLHIVEANLADEERHYVYSAVEAVDSGYCVGIHGQRLALCLVE